MKSREEWLEAAAAAAPGGTYTGQVPLARVRNLDPGQRARFGEFQYMSLDNALRGEAAGKWSVVECSGADR